MLRVTDLKRGLNASVSAPLCPSGDVDIYAFNVTRSSNVSIQLSPSPGGKTRIVLDLYRIVPPSDSPSFRVFIMRLTGKSVNWKTSSIWLMQNLQLLLVVLFYKCLS